jgi:hypothetical protein
LARLERPHGRQAVWRSILWSASSVKRPWVSQGSGNLARLSDEIGGGECSRAGRA